MKYAIKELFDYYYQKQKKVLYVNIENMDFLPQASFSRATLTRPIRDPAVALMRDSGECSAQSGEEAGKVNKRTW